MCECKANHNILFKITNIHNANFDFRTIHLLSLLRVIVFSRPQHLACVYELSKFLYIASSNDTQMRIIDLLCKNSPAKCIRVDDKMNIIQFDEDSCILQIYGSVLEVVNSQIKLLNERNLKLLFKLTANTINFLANSLTNYVQWVREFKQNASNLTCDCYIRIANAFVVLFHLITKHWTFKSHKTGKNFQVL